jgi:hypothetical protein
VRNSESSDELRLRAIIWAAIVFALLALAGCGESVEEKATKSENERLAGSGVKVESALCYELKSPRSTKTYRCSMTYTDGSTETYEASSVGGDFYLDPIGSSDDVFESDATPRQKTVKNCLTKRGTSVSMSTFNPSLQKDVGGAVFATALGKSVEIFVMGSQNEAKKELERLRNDPLTPFGLNGRRVAVVTQSGAAVLYWEDPPSRLAISTVAACL